MLIVVVVAMANSAVSGHNISMDYSYSEQAGMLRHIWKRVINNTQRDHFVTFSNMVDASAFPVTETITQKLQSQF